MLYFRVFPALMASDEAYMGLNVVDDGILFRILRHQCSNGSVPADLSRLGQVLGVADDELREFFLRFTKMKTLQALENGSPDRLAIPYLHRERLEVLAIIEARRKAGARGGKVTQARARSVRANEEALLSDAQAELGANVWQSSSRKEQEQETDQIQIQKDSSTQQHIRLGHNGQVSVSDADADGTISLPADIRDGLSSLGIAEILGADLCEKAGGPRGLRAALGLLEVKRQRGEVRSPSGFFLRCVGDLALEAVAQFEAAYEEAMKTHRKALTDSRWLQLPDACRENLDVLRAWCTWWNIKEQVSSASSSMKDGLVAEAQDARHALIETCLSHHPERSSIVASVEEKVTHDASQNPFLTKRLRMSLVEAALGFGDRRPIELRKAEVRTA